MTKAWTHQGADALQHLPANHVALVDVVALPQEANLLNKNAKLHTPGVTLAIAYQLTDFLQHLLVSHDALIYGWCHSPPTGSSFAEHDAVLHMLGLTLAIAYQPTDFLQHMLVSHVAQIGVMDPPQETSLLNMDAPLYMPRSIWAIAYQPTDFLQHLLVSHDAGLVWLIALPQEAGLVPAALLDMPVQAVVRNVGLTTLEPLDTNVSLVQIEVFLVMLVLKLQPMLVLSFKLDQCCASSKHNR